MGIHEFLAPPSETARRHGPHDRIVMSSRVRLARNMREFPFPGWAKKAERALIYENVRPAVESLPELKGCFSEAMDKLSALDKQILVERHLISREHAAKGAGSGLVLNRDETLCVMINEEDHLRMQALRPGLQLRQAWADGTTHLVFGPIEFLGRLAVLVPLPRINLILYHGVLAPRKFTPKPGADPAKLVGQPMRVAWK